MQGGLTRPDDLLAFLAAKERGESYNEGEYADCLTRAVADTVRRHVEAGLDVVDDGEMGKATWITYLYERVSGPRAPHGAGGGREHPAAEPRPAGVP